ncbi:MAG TPA: ankyrin repeat domain-containing protein [Anaerolineales bacterium]|nr:ankyrin repeat domain-containing protein [Anaerolineales bacterium]
MDAQTPVPLPPLTEEQIRDFVVAAHGNLPRVREMVVARPDIVNAVYYWSSEDPETAIQAAAQSGSTQVAEYLLAHGAQPDIFVAAMLGRKSVVEAMLQEDPGLINARGVHGISLMAHAAWSNNVELAQMLYDRGATVGTSHALGNAVTKGNVQMARWLIQHGNPDFSWKNYEGKSLLALAKETPNRDMIDLLTENGAV